MNTFVPSGYSRLTDFAKINGGAEKVGPDLAGGVLKAFRLDAWGKLHPLAPDVFRGPHAGDILNYGKVNGRHLGKSAPDRGDIVLISLPTSAPAQAAKGGPAKAGRQPKAFWEAAIIEMGRIVLDEGAPATQAEMQRRIEDWLIAKGYEYTETPLKERVRAVYKAWGLRQ